MKTRRELERLWARVVEHLEAAARLLPEPPRRGDEGGSIDNYRDSLTHNELELALDELEMLGDANAVSPAYWRELEVAARLMDLNDHERRCRSRVTPST